MYVSMLWFSVTELPRLTLLVACTDCETKCSTDTFQHLSPSALIGTEVTENSIAEVLIEYSDETPCT